MILRIGISIFAFGVAGSAAADPIYRHIDPSGKVTYESAPSRLSSKPVELPKIQKENFTKKLTDLEKQMPESCDRRGGIDCEKGADKADGSVICLDGYRNVRQNFIEECSQVRLQLISESFVDKTGAVIAKPFLRPEAYGGHKPEKILISIRNLSAVPALKVSVAGEIVKRKFQAQGPEEIAPYALERYEVPVDRNRLPPFADFRSRYKTVVNCANCFSIQKTHQ